MNNRTSRFAWTTALALGTLVGVLIGVGLPRTQAQAPASPSAAETQALAARLQRLEDRVNALEGQVNALKSRPMTFSVPGIGPAPGKPLGPGSGFGGPSAYPQWQGWQIVPVTK